MSELPSYHDLGPDPEPPGSRGALLMALAHAFVVEQQPQPRAELVHRTSEAAAAAREKRGARISAAAPRGS